MRRKEISRGRTLVSVSFLLVIEEVEVAGGGYGNMASS